MMFERKIVLILLCLLIPGLVWAQDIPQEKARVLVVYYSRTGHTQMVAEKLAQRFGADLEELIDLRKRTGPVDFILAGRDAIMKNTTILRKLKHNPQDYDLIIIGGPTWNKHITPAVRTFITKNNLSAKRIALFGTCHLVGVQESLDEAAGLISLSRYKNISKMGLKAEDLKAEMLEARIDEFDQAITEGK